MARGNDPVEELWTNIRSSLYQGKRKVRAGAHQERPELPRHPDQYVPRPVVAYKAGATQNAN